MQNVLGAMVARPDDSDHRWKPIERITVGWLYRSIYKSFCDCGALLKRNGEITQGAKPHHSL